MRILEFSIKINAPVDHVYQTMVDKNHFKQWISAFGAEFSFKGSWGKGEKIIYLAPDENGVMHGMISHIKENIPNEQIFVQPCGILENGQEILEGEKVHGLNQSYEKYTFDQQGDITTVTVETAVYEDLEDYFTETWPQALDKLKAICERDS